MRRCRRQSATGLACATVCFIVLTSLTASAQPIVDNDAAAESNATPSTIGAGPAVVGVTAAATLGGLGAAALVVVTSGSTLIAISAFDPNARGLAFLAMLSALVGAPALIATTAGASALVLVGAYAAPAIGVAAAGTSLFCGMLGAGVGLVLANTLVPVRARGPLATAAAAVGGLVVFGVVGAGAGGGVSAAFLVGSPPPTDDIE